MGGEIVELHKKFDDLKNIIKNYGSLAVAFSGGVDSTFLLKAAYDVLGGGVVAVTARSPFFPERETEEAVKFCKFENITHIFCVTEPLKIEKVAQNAPERCYECKKDILKKIKEAAAPYNIKYIAEGSHADDDESDRPGFRAVLEHGVKSPLKEAGMKKSDIRALSKELGLKSWDKPAAACLATRFAFWEPLTKEKLRAVETAESFLSGLGFSQIRVRSDGKTARIEIDPDKFAKILEGGVPRMINEKFREYGFTHAALDLGGYKPGGANGVL